jgi:RNA polymerase sigma factor (sigma-70 family)
VETFEQLAIQFEPMIHKIIQSLHIYKNQDQFYQTGLISLWEASKSFDVEKGKFSNYAYTYIKGKIQSEMSGDNKLLDKNIYPKEEYWDTIEDQDSGRPLEVELLLSYCKDLTKKETKWVLSTFIDSLTVREIAESENVTVSAVKQWRSGAIGKLRGKLAI